MIWALLLSFLTGAFLTVMVLAVLGGAIWTFRHDDPEIAEALGEAPEPFSPAPDGRGMTSSCEPACADARGAGVSGAEKFSDGWSFAGLVALTLMLDTLVVLGVVKAAEMICGH
jgi:hypothetical protein